MGTPDKRPIPARQRIQTLKKRREFLRLRGGRRWTCASFVIESKPQIAADEGAASAPRIGYTVTKRMGSAVVRNRIKRRFRSAVAALEEGQLRPGFDYVLIARSGALKRGFVDLTQDLRNGLASIHRHKRNNQTRKHG